MLEHHHFAPGKLSEHCSSLIANNTIERQPEIFYVYSWKNTAPSNKVVLPKNVYLNLIKHLDLTNLRENIGLGNMLNNNGYAINKI